MPLVKKLLGCFPLVLRVLLTGWGAGAEGQCEVVQTIPNALKVWRNSPQNFQFQQGENPPFHPLRKLMAQPGWAPGVFCLCWRSCALPT